MLQDPSSARTLNPYLVFSFGSSRIENLRGSAKSSTSNPNFMWVEELDLKNPEEMMTEIAVWSKEEGNGEKDLFIGSTILDLEQRWQSREFRQAVEHQNVPTELRPLKLSSDSPKATGCLQLWVDLLLPWRAQDLPRFELVEPQPIDIELRIVIWGTRALALDEKDYVDVQIRVNLDCLNYLGKYPATQETDVHYHSRNGNAIFNYRIIYSHITTPTKSCLLHLQALHFQPLTSAEMIGETNLELSPYCSRVAETLDRRDFDIELPLTNSNREEDEVRGFIQCTLQIIAQTEAAGRPVGLGRGEPNRDPQLVIPLAGRQWTDFLRSGSESTNFAGWWLKVIGDANDTFHSFVFSSDF
eukprot:Gregarina_sp_Poly_1__1957@NODE_1510_length_3974_cov_85_617865_g1001_i0_p2_GENE_NODE_1510_length_3974_cov_85_617865_g1001_i0NODE_1510_length_3974_cov_85_617865_g1001_i0_p2_ORF_typecomplete_len357_score58_32C2/PF00168_30/2_2e05C2/PF00168_30/0_042Ferlin_C/PF16165_5/2_8e05_NODE_1510_length_3974_cov_85_617865_g1001_i021923262